MRRALAALLSCLAISFASAARAEAPAPSSPGPTANAATPTAKALADRAKAAARAMHLADDAGWHRLLHVHPTAQHGWEAEPDGPAFFLSDRGAFDPSAELDATIDALYLPAARGDEHALCTFPARARWLEDFVALDDLPRPHCAARDAFFARLRPKKVIFVFSSYHVESPASAFGHVLLRVERDDAAVLGRSAAPHALADLGIDYSADVGSETFVTYALKGLFGQFRGTFKAMPYAAKVREYQDYESRDLWEYELSFDDEEKRAFVEHLWELGHTSFDYFYATENCAYHVLALLDVARPSARLLDGLSRPVLPSDALASVWRARGLVAKVRFRPSARRVAEARLDRLDAPARALAHDLAAVSARPDTITRLANMPPATRAAVLDAALDLLDLDHPELLRDGEDTSAARERKFSLVAARAAIDVTSPEILIPTPDEPHLAHGARRVAIGTGYGQSGAFMEARARLSFHDMLDPRPGLPPRATLEILELATRIYPRRAPIEVERLTLVRVEKLAPLGTLERGLSYRFFLGGDRVRDRGCAGCFVARVDGSFGAAFEAFPGVLAYARGGIALEASDTLLGIDRRAIRLGIGPTVGVKLDLGRHLGAIGEGRVAWLPGSPHPVTAEATFEARLSLGPASALGLYVRRSYTAGELGLASFVYF